MFNSLVSLLSISTNISRLRDWVITIALYHATLRLTNCKIQYNCNFLTDVVSFKKDWVAIELKKST